MGQTKLRLGLLATTALTAGLAQAQDTDGTTLLDEIRIESAGAQAVLGNDQIMQNEIEGRNAATTADVFDGESSITASGGAAIGQKVFVNGIEESLLNVTIDGARQNKSAFHHTGNVLLDPALLKSVEVSKGLAPADAGPGGVAGSIAYEMKDASDLLDPGDNFGGIATIGANTNGTDLRSSLTLFGQSEGFEYLISGTRMSGSDYEDGSGTRVEGTEPELTDYVAKVGFTTNAGGQLSFSASQTEDTGRRAAQAGPGGILFIRPDFFGVSGVTNTLVEGLSRRTSYTLTYEHNADGEAFNPSVQLSFNEQEIDAVGVAGVNTSVSGFVKNEFSIASGTVTAGLDFFSETAEGEGRGPGPFGSSGEESLRNAGLFVQVRQDVSDRVSVSYGARYDWQNFEAADGSDFSDIGLSVNGSVDVILNDNWTLNAGAASTWGGYELGEAALINFGGAWDYTGFTASRGQSARVGLRFDNGIVDASATLFHTEVEDIAAVLPQGGARGATADLSSRGIEASLGYTWDQGFARLNYTYADVELNGAAVGSTAYYLGRPLGSILAAEAAWDVNDAWRVGGTAEIAFENDDTPTTLPGYEVVNLYATYRPRQIEGLDIRFDVRNFFDRTYSARSNDGIDNSRVVPLTEPGRTFGITATMRF